MSVATRVLYRAIVTPLRLYLVLLMHVVSLEALSQAEIDQKTLVIVAQHQIGALDVAMRVAALVNVLETEHDLTHETHDADFV